MFTSSTNFCECCSSAISWPRTLPTPDATVDITYPDDLGPNVPHHLCLDRLETASFLRSNSIFQYLIGLQSFPDLQTLRLFLLYAPDAFWQQMHRLNDRLLQTFIHLPFLIPVELTRPQNRPVLRLRPSPKRYSPESASEAPSILKLRLHAGFR